jgi:hypothetical protein
MGRRVLYLLTKWMFSMLYEHYHPVCVRTIRGVEGSYTVTAAVVEQRRAASTRHGTRSEVLVRDAARAQKRRILRRLGVRSADLDAVSAVLVDVLARSLALAGMLDRFYAGRGVVREDGQGEPTLAVYLSALNQARLTAAKLAEHMSRQGVTGDDLRDYIVENYGANGDG